MSTNTLASALVPDVVREAVITTGMKKLALLNAYSTDFGADELAPRKTVQVGKATDGSTTLTNPTDFEQGDSTLGSIAVTVNQYSQPFHLTNNELQSGHKLEKLVKANVVKFMNTIVDIALAPVTVANYGAAVFTGAANTFDIDDLKTIWGAGKDFDVKNLVLDGDYFAQFLPADKDSFAWENGAYGFDGFHLNTRWDGADTNVVGFNADPSALAVASGVPSLTPAVRAELFDSELIELPGLGLQIQMNHWASAKSRAEWMSLDVMFGAAAGDTDKLDIITSA
jgi:hypothetical protein